MGFQGGPIPNPALGPGREGAPTAAGGGTPETEDETGPGQDHFGPAPAERLRVRERAKRLRYCRGDGPEMVYLWTDRRFGMRSDGRCFRSRNDEKFTLAILCEFHSHCGGDFSDTSCISGL